MPRSKVASSGSSPNKSTKRATNVDSETFIYTSQSFSSVVTPNGSIEKQLSIHNDNGKVKGSYVEKKDGKQTVKKEFRSQRGLDAIQKVISQK